MNNHSVCLMRTNGRGSGKKTENVCTCLDGRVDDLRQVVKHIAGHNGVYLRGTVQVTTLKAEKPDV